MKAHTVQTGKTPWFIPNTTLVLDLPSESPAAIPRVETIRYQTVSLTVMVVSDCEIEVEGRRIEFIPWANGLRPNLFHASGYWFVFNKDQIQALEGYDYDGIDFQMKYMDPERLYAAKFNPALGYLEIHAEEGLFAEAETSGSGSTKRMRLSLTAIGRAHARLQ